MNEAHRPPNRNYLWAEVIVEELARSGVQDVCIAPGSRSTPLTIAFARHGGVKVYSHIDERSASFFALGIARVSKRPVALVCTSGTAAANFYPAIIEARYGGLSLIVLTADRPPELRDSGMNQTIDQVKMYGDHVRWSIELPPPEEKPSALTIRSLRSLACRAYHMASGMGGIQPHGVVHINMPFRKPLEPVIVESDNTDDPDFAGRADGAPYTSFGNGRLFVPDHEFAQFSRWMKEAKRPLVIVGPDRSDRFSDLNTILGYRLPVLTDPLSGARFHTHHAEVTDEKVRVIGGYDQFLKAHSAIGYPDVILHLGSMPTSQTLIDYMNASIDCRHIFVADDGHWRDANYLTDNFIYVDAAKLIYALGFTQYRISGEEEDSPALQWFRRLRQAEQLTWEITHAALDEDFFDGAVVADVFARAPDECAIFLGNSLPVRHADQFARPSTKNIRVYGNRGASGIDGNISTALGAAAASPDQLPLICITGDLTFYHDMNGLMATRRCGVNAVFVVLNNDGGGIFSQLPVAQFEPHYTELFRTPHGMTFDHVAALYGLEYTHAADRTAFGEAFDAAIAALPHRSTLIEVQTDPAHDLARRNAISAQVADAVRHTFTSGKTE